MKVGVLGDIHGNIYAFRAVLKDIKKESITKLLITGDLIGYYYHADKVLNIIKNLNYELVQGNHESMLGEILSWSNEKRDEYRRKYGSALEYAAKELLSKKEIDYLKSLPDKKELFLGDRSILLCHGSPWNRDEYIYPDASDDILKRCADNMYDVVIMGHTHYAMLKNVNSTILLNPGSVGQPRDGQCGASWVILNLDDLSVEFRRTTYNVEKLIIEIKDRDPDVVYLVDILKRKNK